MTKKSLIKKGDNSFNNIEYKLYKIYSFLIIFLLINSLLNYSIPISLNPIFLTILYICNGLIIIFLVLSIYFNVWLMIEYGK